MSWLFNRYAPLQAGALLHSDDNLKIVNNFFNNANY